MPRITKTMFKNVVYFHTNRIGTISDGGWGDTYQPEQIVDGESPR